MSLAHERIVDGHLEAAIQEFEHPGTTSTISLVGMRHNALPSFYASTLDYIHRREAEGSIVHYEAAVLPDRERLATYPEWVQEFAPRLSAGINDVQTSDNKSRVSQSDESHFPYKQAWELHDLNIADITLALGYDRAEFMTTTTERALAIAAGRKKPHSLDRLRMRSILPLTYDVVIWRRNKVAVQAVHKALEKNPDQSLTLLWGGLHLPGIARGIRSRGYVHRNTLWQKAYQT